MSSAKRNQLRSALLSKKEPKKEIVTLFGEEVEFRQPSLEEVLNRNTENDPSKALISLLVNYCYVPDTEEKVFESSDAAVLLKWPVGEWLETVNRTVEKLTGINIKEAEKN